MNYRQWYDQNILKYEIITTIAELLLKHSLTNEAIDYSLINSRVKDYESFEEKMVRKKYNSPQSMTDIAGIRIVCFVLSDVRLVSSVVEQIFRVDWNNSVDKFKEIIKRGKMGYTPWVELISTFTVFFCPDLKSIVFGETAISFSQIKI